MNRKRACLSKSELLDRSYLGHTGWKGIRMIEKGLWLLFLCGNGSQCDATIRGS